MYKILGVIIGFLIVITAFGGVLGTLYLLGRAFWASLHPPKPRHQFDIPDTPSGILFDGFCGAFMFFCIMSAILVLLIGMAQFWASYGVN